MDYFEVSGTAYEVGRQAGARFAQFVAYVCSRGKRHSTDPPASSQEFDEWVAQMEEKWPYEVQEVRGYAEGAGIPFEEAFLTNFGDGIRARSAQSSCSNIAFRESPHGLVLAGTLDDSPIYYLQRTQVKGRYAHLGVFWPGWLTGWGGVNEHGLAVSGSSARLRKSPVQHPGPGDWHSIYGARATLEQCRNVEEAIEFLKRPDIPGHGNHILIDADGNGAVVEKNKPSFDYLGERTWEENGTLLCGNFFLSEVSPDEPTEDQTLKDAQSRFKILSQAAERGIKEGVSLELLQETLRTHDGPEHGPGGVCNNGTTLAMIALPKERRFLIAPRYPCRNEFVSYEL